MPRHLGTYFFCNVLHVSSALIKSSVAHKPSSTLRSVSSALTAGLLTAFGPFTSRCGLIQLGRGCWWCCCCRWCLCVCGERVTSRASGSDACVPKIRMPSLGSRQLKNQEPPLPSPHHTSTWRTLSSETREVQPTGGS